MCWGEDGRVWCAGVRRKGCGVLGGRDKGVVCWGEEGGV